MVGAIVRVNGQRPRGSLTDEAGRYAVVLAPAPAYPIALDVALEGFQDQHRQLSEASESTDFALVSSGTPVAVAGQWTATLVVSPACRSRFPLGAQRRTYDVTITQEAAQAALAFRSPTLETAFVGPQGQYKVWGLAVNSRLSFTIASDSVEENGFLAAYFLDHVSETEELALSVGGSATVASTGFTIPLDGQVQYRTGSALVDCIASDHALQFQPS